MNSGKIVLLEFFINVISFFKVKNTLKIKRIKMIYLHPEFQIYIKKHIMSNLL